MKFSKRHVINIFQTMGRAQYNCGVIRASHNNYDLTASFLLTT